MRVSRSKLLSLYATKTDEQIGDLFGVTGRSIGDWRRHYEIPTKAREPLYALDRDFFEKIDTEEKAYILGLLSADGSVHKNGYQVTLALKVEDEHILHDIKRAMKSDATIADKGPGGFPGSGPRKLVTFNSTKIVSDLAKLGIVPRKSLTLRYPCIPSKLERHFARGSFDGDGHIRRFPKRLFSFLGTKAFIDGLADAIFRHTAIALRRYQVTGCWELSGYGGSADVLHWMYKGATISLERKHRVYLDHWR
jgi:hypothetical protein